MPSSPTLLNIEYVVGISSDIVVAISAGVAAYIAWKGLSTWKHKLKGEADHELARRLLTVLFKYRDAIDGVRHPAMWGHEIELPREKDDGQMDFDEKRHAGLVHAYEKRWDKVKDQRREMYSLMIETEAVWGAEFRKMLDPILSLEHELLMALQRHLEIQNPKTTDSRRNSLSRKGSKKRDIDDVIWATLVDDDSDEFKKEFVSHFYPIEEYLKRYLGR